MVKLNKNGVNAAIKAHILSDEQMREAGFNNNRNEGWYYCKSLGNDITFNVFIPLDGSDISIDVLDENFLQPYDYQMILETKENPPQFAFDIAEKAEREMEWLQTFGILSGHVKGEYI